MDFFFFLAMNIQGPGIYKRKRRELPRPLFVQLASNETHAYSPISPQPKWLRLQAVRCGDNSEQRLIVASGGKCLQGKQSGHQGENESFAFPVLMCENVFPLERNCLEELGGTLPDSSVGD